MSTPTPATPTGWTAFDLSSSYINLAQISGVRFGTDDEGLYAMVTAPSGATWWLRTDDALRLRDIMEAAVRS
jgi:hypothetical protein